MPERSESRSHTKNSLINNCESVNLVHSYHGPQLSWQSSSPLEWCWGDGDGAVEECAIISLPETSLA